MTNSTDVSDMKMTRFGYRVDLIRERDVRVKDEANIIILSHANNYSIASSASITNFIRMLLSCPIYSRFAIVSLFYKFLFIRSSFIDCSIIAA